MADEPESLITEEVELPPGPPGSRFRREFERRREDNRKNRATRPPGEWPELRPADDRGNYYVWNNNLNATRGPFSLLAQDVALEVLESWRKELRERGRIEAHFRNQYRKTAAHRRLERRVETASKRREKQPPPDLEGFEPPEPPPLRADPHTGRVDPPTPEEVAAYQQKVRRAYGQFKREKANREKQGEATKAAATINRQTRSARKEKAHARWRELEAQGVPAHERRQALCRELDISARTLRKYLNS